MGIRRMLAVSGVVGALLAPGLAGPASARQAEPSGDVGVLAAVTYRIEVTTTDLQDAGTDGTVEVRLNGSLASTGFMILDSSADDFERNTTRAYDRTVTDLGTLQSVDVHFISSGDSPDWHLAHIRVTTSGRPAAVFPAHRWFTSTQFRNLPAAANPATYTIRVVTSDIEDAGTDGTVEVRLNGSLGSSVYFDLDNEGVDNFERNTTNTFVRVIDSVGSMESVDVRFDPSGDSPHWHLAEIRVTASPGGSAVFPAHRWFQFNGETRNLPAA